MERIVLAMAYWVCVDVQLDRRGASERRYLCAHLVRGKETILMENSMDTPKLSSEELGGRSMEPVAEALRDIAAAVRESTDRAEPDPLRLLRAEEVAELLALPVRTVRDRAAAGVIPHRRFGKHYRFSRADVEAIVGLMAREASPTAPRVLRAAA
jgi:excisionase family DNA binding protein